MSLKVWKSNKFLFKINVKILSIKSLNIIGPAKTTNLERKLENYITRL